MNSYMHILFVESQKHTKKDNFENIEESEDDITDEQIQGYKQARIIAKRASLPSEEPPSYEESIAGNPLNSLQSQQANERKTIIEFHFEKNGESKLLINTAYVDDCNSYPNAASLPPYKHHPAQPAEHDDGDVGSRGDRLETMQKLQQTMNQRLQQIENDLQAHGNPPHAHQSDRDVREEQISQRVVHQLVNNEQFRLMVQAQQLTTSQAEFTDNYVQHTPSTIRCKKCHCKLTCMCNCHLPDLNEKRKKEREFGGNNQRSCNMQLSQDKNETDIESDVDFLPDFENSFHVMSDVSDHELALDVVTQVPERKHEKYQMSSFKAQSLEHTIQDKHGASGGDPGQPPDDNPSSDDDSDDEHNRGKKQNGKSLKDTRKNETKWVIEQESWAKCIEQDFNQGVARLLDEGKLPKQALLNKACLKYGRTQPEVQRVCKCICSFIKDKSETFLDVWAAYQYNKYDSNYGNEIGFVVLTNGTDHVDVKEFTTYNRCIYDVITKDENQDVKDKEVEDPLSSAEIQDLEHCLKKNAKPQMERHSNLTRVTATWYQSSGYGTSKCSLRKKPCIALYVHIKGYIPLNEEPFSERIGEYDVDVREGVYVLCGGGPNDFHKNVKMGCAIRGQPDGNQMKAGTLGAFIEVESDRNLYAITSAHVVFVGKKLENILEKGHVSYDQYNEAVYQPATSNESFGTVVGALYREGGNGIPGMEFALIKIFEERYPETGTFPEDPTYKDKGFGPETPLEFYSGNVCESQHLSDSRCVFKYGGESKLTEGLCKVHGASVRTNILRDRILDFPITLHDQIEITSVDQTEFGIPGDSGALVLAKHNRELFAVGMFEGKMDGVYFATPLSAILCELEKTINKKCRLKMFQPCSKRPEDIKLYVRDIVKDEVSERLIGIEQGLKELTEQKDQQTRDTQEIKAILLSLAGNKS